MVVRARRTDHPEEGPSSKGASTATDQFLPHPLRRGTSDPFGLHTPLGAAGLGRRVIMFRGGISQVKA